MPSMLTVCDATSLIPTTRDAPPATINCIISTKHTFHAHYVREYNSELSTTRCPITCDLKLYSYTSSSIKKRLCLRGDNRRYQQSEFSAGARPHAVPHLRPAALAVNE